MKNSMKNAPKEEYKDKIVSFSKIKRDKTKIYFNC
jgi:hypothetical protein